MSTKAQTDAENLLIVRDLVNHTYDMVKDIRVRISYIYLCFYIVPLVIQLVFGYTSE